MNAYFNLLSNSLFSLIPFAGITLRMNISCPGTSVQATVQPTSTLISSSDYSRCKEDEVGVNLFSIVIAEFILTKIFDLFYYIVKSCCGDAKGEFRGPYNTHYHCTVFFIFCLQCFVSILYFPMMAVLAPLLIVLSYLFETWKLKMSLKPEIIQFDSVNIK